VAAAESQLGVVGPVEIDDVPQPARSRCPLWFLQWSGLPVWYTNIPCGAPAAPGVRSGPGRGYVVATTAARG